MPALNIHVDGEGCWPDLAWTVGQDGPKTLTTAIVSVACLPHGMLSGAPSVTIRLDLPDGTVALAETSLALFLMAADAFVARHGDPR